MVNNQRIRMILGADVIPDRSLREQEESESIYPAELNRVVATPSFNSWGERVPPEQGI